MTPLQTNLLLEVAKRMPEVLEVWSDGVVTWKDGHRVKETELLHVAAEFEKRMTREERDLYAGRLYSSISWSWYGENSNVGNERELIFQVINAPFESRAQAWLKVDSNYPNRHP